MYIIAFIAMAATPVFMMFGLSLFQVSCDDEFKTTCMLWVSLVSGVIPGPVPSFPLPLRLTSVASLEPRCCLITDTVACIPQD